MVPAFAAALLLPLGLQGGGSTIIQVDAGRGPVDVRLPAGYAAGEPAPLLVALHGHTATPQGLPIFLPFEGFLDAYGFVRVAPRGTLDSTGRYFWNASDACCDYFNAAPDDSTYLRALVTAIQAAVDIDPRRVFAAGYSNGGFMAHRLGLDHADLFAGVVSVNGAGPLDPQRYTPSEPLAVLEVHGTADSVIGYGGGTLAGLAPFPGALETVQHWAAALGCAQAAAPGPDRDLVISAAGPETATATFPGCATNGHVELWTMQGVDHAYDPTPEFAPALLDWMLAHAKRGVTYNVYCTPAHLNNSGRVAQISASGTDALAANDFTLRAESLPTGTFGLFIGALGQIQVPLPTGTNGPLCVGPQFSRLGPGPLATGSTGEFQLLVDLSAIPPVAPQGAASGETWYFQAWHREGGGSGLTDALAVRFW